MFFTMRRTFRVSDSCRAARRARGLTPLDVEQRTAELTRRHPGVYAVVTRTSVQNVERYGRAYIEQHWTLPAWRAYLAVLWNGDVHAFMFDTGWTGLGAGLPHDACEVASQAEPAESDGGVTYQEALEEARSRLPIDAPHVHEASVTSAMEVYAAARCSAGSEGNPLHVIEDLTRLQEAVQAQAALQRRRFARDPGLLARVQQATLDQLNARRHTSDPPA